MKKPCRILALLNQAVSRTKEHRGTNSPNVSPLKSSSIWCKVFNSSWKRSQQLPLTETFTAFSPTIMQKALCGICPHSLFYSSSEDLLGRQQWPRKSAGLPICSHPLLMGNVAGERRQLDRWESLYLTTQAILTPRRYRDVVRKAWIWCLSPSDAGKVNAPSAQWL